MMEYCRMFLAENWTPFSRTAGRLKKERAIPRRMANTGAPMIGTSFPRYHAGTASAHVSSRPGGRPKGGLKDFSDAIAPPRQKRQDSTRRTLMDRTALSRTAFDRGFTYEEKYRSCGQCVVAAVQDTLGIRNDFVFKCASSLGGGIGKLCDGSCGAYTGSVLMIGFFWGRTRDKFDGDVENKKAADRLTVSLHEKFVEEFGSITCREIHDRLFGRRFDLWNEADKAAFDEAGAHRDKCTRVVASAASWVTELVLGELSARGQALEEYRSQAHPEA
jgi:C_GCAxxG_C_C family probable redox protein